MNGETTIYLAGNISPDPETYKWRQDATDILLHSSKRIRVIDPTACIFNRELRKHSKDMPELIAYVKEHPEDMGVLAPKDYHFVLQSDIIFANLSLIHPEKPLIGTTAELAWAWDYHKPVIAVSGADWYCMEPFIQKFVSSWVTSVSAGCELILRHWG